MAFVIDASATLPWCFEDEATPWTESLLDRLAAREHASVPAHWPTEVSNSLLMALRKKRITLDRVQWFWDKLALLPILVEPPLTSTQIKVIFTLSSERGLTFYDGTYLELAKRLALPLATLDSALLKASQAEEISLIS